MQKYLVIDVGGTAIKYAVMDDEANFLEQGETPTKRADMEDFLGAMDTVVLPRKEEVTGIAMSMPGKIDNITGFLYTGGALSFIHNTPMKEILEARYHLPVAIENDGKCAALAEAWIGNLNDATSGAVCILGTGIGGGIVLNGKVWRGFKGSAGELSAVPTLYDGPTSMASCWALMNGYGGLTGPYAKIKGLDKHEVNGKVFFEALHNGDKDAAEIFDTFCENAATGIINLQAVLDVEKVCIGGGISAQDILIETIGNKVLGYFERCPYTPVNLPVIDRCKFRNGANLIGALKNFMDLQ